MYSIGINYEFAVNLIGRLYNSFVKSSFIFLKFFAFDSFAIFCIQWLHEFLMEFNGLCLHWIIFPMLLKSTTLHDICIVVAYEKSTTSHCQWLRAFFPSSYYSHPCFSCRVWNCMKTDVKTYSSPVIVMTATSWVWTQANSVYGVAFLHGLLGGLCTSVYMCILDYDVVISLFSFLNYFVYIIVNGTNKQLDVFVCSAMQ